MTKPTADLPEVTRDEAARCINHYVQENIDKGQAHIEGLLETHDKELRGQVPAGTFRPEMLDKIKLKLALWLSVQRMLADQVPQSTTDPVPDEEFFALMSRAYQYDVTKGIQCPSI